MNRELLQSVTLELENWVSEREYRGYDPYDGLRSKILRLLPLPGKYSKIAWIQFFKRCPVNLRSLFLIPKGRNPKGMGLFLSSYTYLYRATGEQVWLDKAFEIANWLESHVSPGYSGKCWGYNFDWQSRAFFIPRGTPTIVNTSFIGHAFLDLFEVTGDNRWLEVAQSACEFILNDLNRYEDEKAHLCFSYSPIDNTKVHNANLLGSGLLARTAKLLNQNKWDKIIRQSMMYTLARQHENGAWYYAESDYQNWVDSFHTGFNLMSLRYIYEFLQSGFIFDAIERGENYYAKNFFLADGTPKYYHNRVYPIDIHAPAMALRYFSTLDNFTDLTAKVSSWMIGNMRDKSGYFTFQKNSISLFKRRLFYPNVIPYMRWGQAWALYGLTYYLLTISSNSFTQPSLSRPTLQYETALN